MNYRNLKTFLSIILVIEFIDGNQLCANYIATLLG